MDGECHNKDCLKERGGNDVQHTEKKTRKEKITRIPVSYTHLTLPTSDLV